MKKKNSTIAFKVCGTCAVIGVALLIIWGSLKATILEDDTTIISFILTCGIMAFISLVVGIVLFIWEDHES